MGIYINPPHETKEQWLKDNAILLEEPPIWSEVSRGRLPVCLVDNRAFTAAGIAYDARELDAFVNDGTTRPKKWFLVSIEDLVKVAPELKRIYPDGHQ